MTPINNQAILRCEKLEAFYGTQKVLKSIQFAMREKAIYALIGPSGCGKSTLLRCFNRMNDFITHFSMQGKVFFKNNDIFSAGFDPVTLRKQVGMVFQKPNPFPSSIYKNITWGPKINGLKINMDQLVEESLRKAALWDEVKDRLHKSGLSLSGGQQQRLCIARAIAMNPDVILMDEPCSALDPTATAKIEELLKDLKKQYSILMVTHNMQQAARVSDFTAFMYKGDMVELGLTTDVFSSPKEQLTDDYIRGRFG